MFQYSPCQTHSCRHCLTFPWKAIPPWSPLKTTTSSCCPLRPCSGGSYINNRPACFEEQRNNNHSMAEHSNIAQPVEILKSKCGPDVSTHFEMKEWRETLEQQSRRPQTQKNRDKAVGFPLLLSTAGKREIRERRMNEMMREMQTVCAWGPLCW